MTPAPLTGEELRETTEALISEGGMFAVMPMTVNGVDYDRVFAASNLSVRDLMAMKAAEFADREFITYGEERYSFGETWARAMRFANWLIDAQGIRPGDRVGIAMRNYPEWCVAYLGIVATGATVVPLNAWWESAELRDGIRRAELRVIVCDAKRAGMIAPAKDELGLFFIGAREEVPEADARLSDIIGDEALPATTPQVQIDPDLDFCLLYTSGSTGKPKGALLTHRSAINSILSFSFLLNVAQRLRPEYPFVPEDPTVLLSLPLFHVTASHSVFLLSFLTGKRLVFLYRWDAKAAADLIEKEKVTNVIGVPTMAHDLVMNAGPGQLDTLVDIATGGAKRPPSQLEAQTERKPGLGMSSGYGLTETNALGTYITLQDYLDRPASAGRAIPPVTRVEALSGDGKILPRGEQGEICIKSPATFRAYLDDAAATRAAYHEGGWFRTGDLGYIDEEDYLFIVDRVKDLIIRGGENISCLEVENALLAADGVTEATVFSVPDERFGEIVGAVIYGADRAPDPKAVRDAVARELAAFKVPEKIWVSPQQLPRGATGKVDKRQTRQIAIMHPPHWSAS
jgi:acyl-CoA synthetase (AMP-forming)/AMP-acid ligase II